MRFPEIERVRVPATFKQFQAGRIHPSGKRFLPLIVLGLEDGGTVGVVDRHHTVAERDVGSSGIAHLIFQLSTIRLQQTQQRGLRYESLAQISTAPAADGQITTLLTWEHRRDLGYDAIYTEMIVDVGIGTIGVRTTITAPDFAAAAGVDQFRVGDWITLERSRIDILGFEPDSVTRSAL